MEQRSILITGPILSADLLEQLDSLPGQKEKDFGLPAGAKLRDEIGRAWGDATDYWRIFKRKREALPEKAHGTTETRNQWLVPLLTVLGYQPSFSTPEQVGERSFDIPFRDKGRDELPLVLVSFRDSLDRKPGNNRGSRSPHALLQEYLNHTEHAYGLVSNGLQLRLLRDSGRISRLSYVEFDLQRIMDEQRYTDFALLFRLLHASRMPQRREEAAGSFIEQYHQQGLADGERIRDDLSNAVEKAIQGFADAFLADARNADFVRTLQDRHAVDAFYHELLRLIYRLLFLMVIEERHLVYPDGWHRDEGLRRLADIYFKGYSLQRLRQLVRERHRVLANKDDLWIQLRHTFRLFEDEQRAQALGLRALGGELFSPAALARIGQLHLCNGALLHCLLHLTEFDRKDTRTRQQVNYGALNVEEFGSVYEGLLEYEPSIQASAIGPARFVFVKGDERAKSGSHYTPEELVQPLIKHSLDHLIAERLATPGKFVQPAASMMGKDEHQAQALLALKIADVACGSGHILISAARRLAEEVARVRTGEEQPNPAAYRAAKREVIRHCIYGVDKNPLAVELCKVALWLEAHAPGEPLGFLDHHIKCGDAIVGLGRREELQRGIADEAFKALPGDDKEVAKAFRDRNRQERRQRAAESMQLKAQLESTVGNEVHEAMAEYRTVLALPERSPAEVQRKEAAYRQWLSHAGHSHLHALADLQVAQFFLPKTLTNKDLLLTDADHRLMLAGQKGWTGPRSAKATALGQERRFFHWFLEFPEVFEGGGFDCVLGNPPYKGGQALSGSYGHAYCEWLRTAYAPTGLSDLVVFFLRRIHGLLTPNGFTAFITTNSIKDGDVRKDGLEQVIAQGAVLNMVVRAIKWPGKAKLVVSLLSLHKGPWNKDCWLDGKPVPLITAFFESEEDLGEAQPLKASSKRIFQGSIFLGNGFLLSKAEAIRMLEVDSSNGQVVRLLLNGDELNNNPDQLPVRYCINFLDKSEPVARRYKAPFAHVVTHVRPERENQSGADGKEAWWQFLRPRMEMVGLITNKPRCFAAAATTKYLNFSAQPTDRVFSHALYVFTTDRWSDYAVVQNNLHEAWARKYSGALKRDLRYSPSDCFVNFPFPKGHETALATIGKAYHEHRRQWMQRIWYGLTDLYNLFHDPLLRQVTEEELALEDKAFEKLVGKQARLLRKHLGAPGTKAGCTFNEAVQAVEQLRALHLQLDQTVLEAYGWGSHPATAQGSGEPPIALRHAFYEVDYLPENDRVRYTIHPEARKEVLKRLLALNHQRRQEEEAQGLWEKKGRKGKKYKKAEGTIEVKEPEEGYGLFAQEHITPPARDNGQPAEAIFAFLSSHAGWHGKSAILEATGVEPSQWNTAIKELLDTGKVKREGEKKGARYGV